MPDYEARIQVLTDENELLREENLRLKKEIGIAQEAPILFHHLTTAEGTILNVLLANKAPRKSTFMLALYGNKSCDAEEAQEKIIDVFICKLRPKMAEFGVKIETIWGNGYYIPDADKEKLRGIINGQA